MSKPKILQLEEEIEKLKEPQKKVLWENSSPSSEMPADTLIDLSSDEYDEILWFFRYNTSEANSILQMSVSCLKGNGVILQGIGYSTNNTIRRILDYANDTQYKARIGKMNTTDDTSVAIPVVAIGIKY